MIYSSPIFASAKAKRISENMDLFDFCLNQDEIQFIYNLKKEVYQKYVENIYGEWNEENQKKLFNKFMKENSK